MWNYQGAHVNEQQGDIGALLRQGCRLLQIEIDDEALARLVFYYASLLRWSKKVNLIGKKQQPRQIVENHFLDSLILLRYLQKIDTTLLDVGSGAGFPGLVCKTVLPSLGLILVEPRLKRVSFLRHIIRSLKMEGAVVRGVRLEDLDADQVSCSHITGRAVAKIGDFLSLVEGTASPESEILCMKGPRWRQELDEASAVLDSLSVTLCQVDEFTLPFSGVMRAVLTFRI